MQLFYLVSVWLHILAAITWIGGMMFLVLIVVPWMRRADRAVGSRFLRETGLRFRRVGWACFGVVVVTGSINLWVRGVQLSDFGRAEWLASPFGKTIVSKLAVFAIVLVVSLVHDFFVGPNAARALEKDPSSPEAQRLRRSASLLGRLNAVLALVLVGIGVTLVRGCAW